jgi:GH25 family lysozyme M1 (1,4-beta-N-acetylmuramidase)
MSVPRVDGIHWGTGEDLSSGFFDLAHPESPTVINEPEAQWHYAEIQRRRPQAVNVWRSSPAVKPAQSGWSGHAFSREVFKGIDQHHDRTGVYPTDILLLNELNLDYERGDAKNDGGAFDTNPDNWPFLYTLVSGFLESVLVSCKERATDRGFTPRWWFPGWAPGHGEYRPEIASIWIPVAKKYDAVCLHSYTNVDTITSDVLWYLRAFPGKDVGLFEWNTMNLPPEPHTSERYEMEVAIRSRLQALGRAYSNVSATYFIYAWKQDHSHEHDIKGDHRRTAIWSGQVEIPYDPWVPGPLHPEPPVEPPGDPPMPQTFPLGIDVSNNNGAIDWTAVAGSGVQFAIAKITEGTTFRDGWFSTFWPEMKRVGLRRGAYHFARPSRNSALAEAKYFVDAFAVFDQVLEPGDVVALDLEDENARGDLSAWTLQWCQHVEGWLGWKPVVYCSPGYINDHQLRNAPQLGDYGLWLASWGVPTPPPAPAPWSLVAIHQYAVGNPGTIPGVSGEIDLNHFNGAIEQFDAYGMPGADLPVPPEPSEFVVGEGILTEMHGRGSEPASNEIYTQFWSEAMDIDGRIYRYLPKTNRVYVYSPE